MKLDDRLYIETDDSCALCGIRGGVLTIHHIDGDGANNVYENAIVICHNCHITFHQGDSLSEEEIRDRKKTPDSQDAHYVWPERAQDRRSQQLWDRRYAVPSSPSRGPWIHESGRAQMGYGAQDDATARFAITERGRALLKAWF